MPNGSDVKVGDTKANAPFSDAWKKHLSEKIRSFQHNRPSRAVIAADLLALFKSDPELRQRFDHLGPKETVELTTELVGQAVEDFADALPRGTIWGLAGVKARRHEEVLERGGKGMHYYDARRFENWGQTVDNRPSQTFIPQTKEGVCNLVRWAKLKNKTVRVAGYRHTWGEFFSEDNQSLVSLLPLKFVEDLPSIEPKLNPENELQGIKIVGTVDDNGIEKVLCQIGAATTNEMFREWCIGHDKNDWRWTLPFNVVMVEITYGGSNAPICHGAGWKSTTLSDLVAAIEFVNARGELQTVSDPALLKVAAGCFGLLGVVTSITLKLDPMSYARMQPRAPRLPLTIPPPANFSVPTGIDMTGITAADLAAAQREFIERCETHYYAEWFWFAFQERCWVNTWKNDGLKDDAKDYPGDVKTEWQEAMEYMAEVANLTVFKLLPDRAQAKFMSTLAMLALPIDKTIVTPLIDALHFQRGIQNMRVRDMEFEIPIPGRADAPHLPDWSICQRAWWDVVRIVYSRNDTPMRLAMEMRVTGGSVTVLAPQHGNRHGTCSIEVLTTLNTPPTEWASFMAEVAEAWSAYTDENGVPLNIRPHWAKEWRGLTVRNKPVIDYLKDSAYAARLPELKHGFEAIAQAGGYTVADLRERFSNPLLRALFGSAMS